jgi:amino acid adenylation domain-containing protein
MMSHDLLPELIDATAGHAPDREAIRYRDVTLTYEELSRKTNQLAHALVDAGVKRGDRVGILAPKSAESAIAIYGIMKAGGAYVPVDPSAPVDRQEQVIRDCGIRCLVTAPRQSKRIGEILQRKVAFDCLVGMPPDDEASGVNRLDWQTVYQHPAERPPDLRLTTDDLAYVIYTSGSTGRPKGIVHSHHSGLSFARWAADAYGLTGADRLSNHAPLHFDLSIFDYFAGAVAGATTIIIPEAYTKLPATYSQLLQDDRVSVLFTVPFALIQLLSRGVLERRDLSPLRWVIFGGEPFPPKHLQELMKRLPDAKFDNMYGPAEINGCTHYTVPPIADDCCDEPIPIGPLNPNCEGVIVDGDDLPVPSGQAGELLVSTPTMMQGYWDQPTLNAKAFYRRMTASDGKEQVFYRTGDLVMMRDDGNLLFLGRKDRQVKSRGYRVELDEVESALVSHDAIEEAAAYLIEDSTEGDSRIEAAVTLKQEGAVDAIDGEALLIHARSTLPWYAVPTRISLRPEFPRTTTGKIDRRKLQTDAASQAGSTRADIAAAETNRD